MKKNFKEALLLESPLQVVGVINAYVARMAEKVGYQAIYLSGAGVANSSYGVPDVGITTVENVCEDVRRITEAVDLPLLVDIDTGWENIRKSVREIELAGAAAVHIEDQIPAKKCGHLDRKQIVSKEEMVDRVKQATHGREDPEFVIMARTDAYSIEGLEGAIERGIAYREAGANMLFPEAMGTLEEYRKFREAVGIPILANLTEFGKTPLFTVDELKSVGVELALYPLSANRAMNQAALTVLKEIRKEGSQKNVIDLMQTRAELYEFLDYEDV